MGASQFSRPVVEAIALHGNIYLERDCRMLSIVRPATDVKTPVPVLLNSFVNRLRTGRCIVIFNRQVKSTHHDKEPMIGVFLAAGCGGELDAVAV
ncbi:MAG: hypothetical protein KatS3mg111_3585 [Pirellulaceae bacterium]|nr:MAG: hypothetical protein KatS3mg111_3585 [Pirellulaceae bacterium]